MTRVGIIGAGSIGGHLAAMLAAEGHTVSITARGGNLTAISDDGLHVSGAFGEFHERVRAQETLPDVDAVVLATKTLDTETALAANPIAAERPVLVIQNGLNGHGRAATILGHERVAGGISTTAANLIEPGRIDVTAAGKLFIGGREGEFFTELLQGAVPGVAHVDGIEGAQWTKLVINMVNAVPALVDRSVQDTIATPPLLRIITASMRETVRIGRASGNTLRPLQGLSTFLLRLIEHGPLPLAAIVPRRMAAVMGDVPNLGSTQQSIVRGKPTEIGYLNGAVVDAARRVGREAPVNAAITALVHEREARSEPFTVDEVAQRIPLR
ncbi:ketopantoate reductase family protein [uncultured Agrococcus sp.]|uniref:ketopantoate reductase family protein n=1 Tax=uncultured Agrococcus sp. TaxID=382258 RepID=UPI0025FAC775|nr:2-dehydropantoate 2-reductase [uncultured Agrococcus sp.]